MAVEIKFLCRSYNQADLEIGKRFDTPGSNARHAVSGW